MLYMVLFFVFLFLSLSILLFNLKNDNSTRDIVSDYNLIRQALLDYKRETGNKTSLISHIKDYLTVDSDILINKYSISLDNKFIVVKSKLSEKEYLDILKEIGGNSYFNKEEGRLYLSISQLKQESIEPKAVLNYFPKDNLKTTTKIEWVFKDSIVDGGEIKEVEWENKKERYVYPGRQRVGLRVQDKFNNWSDWVFVDIDITEEQGVKGLAAGITSLFRIRKSGKVDAYGQNNLGQLGDGTLIDRENLSYLRQLDYIKSIAVGESHTLYRTYDGKVLSVGNNVEGQLGLGSRANHKSPQSVWGLDRIKEIAANGDYSLALNADGVVYSWGVNSHGQLGEHGVPSRDIPKTVGNVTKVKSICAGLNHALCLHYDGTITSWGDNSHGQLGIGYKGRQSEPTVANIAGCKYISAGKDYTLVVLDTGRVKGFGLNNHNQLGIYGDGFVTFPKDVPELRGIVKIVSSNTFSIALSEIGEVFTWGRYSTKEGEIYPKPIKIEGLEYIQDIACTLNNGFALLSDGTVYMWNGKLELTILDIKE